MKKILYISIFIVAVIASPALSAVSFTDGFWSSTFDCDDWTQPGALSCDGIEMADDSAYCGGSPSASSIASSFNNAAGEGGKGYRTYFLGGSHNGMSTPSRVTFSSAQKEFWLRFYYRLPTGQSVGSVTTEHKIIYAFTDGAASANVNWPGGGDRGSIMLQPRNTMGSPDIYYGGTPDYSGHNGHGLAGAWDVVYGSLEATADDTWHYFEFYFDLGTDDSNGIFRMWIDGVNRVNDTDLDWGAGGDATGWTNIDFPNNHNYFTATGCVGNDIDDIAVALPSYTGFITDSGGRNMIGGLNVIDNVPAAFDFQNQTGVALGSTGNSDNAAMTAFDNTTTLVLTGDASCKYSINGAAWATANDNVSLNDNVALQNKASDTLYSTAVGCTLTVGGVANTGAPWTRTTLAASLQEGTAKQSTFSGHAGSFQ